MNEIAILKSVFHKLGTSDQNFAGSLIDGFDRYGRVSEKQLYWVNILIQRANGAAPMAVSEVVSVVAIKNLFAKASKSLKRMKIKLQTEDNQKVVFSIAGERSKYNGQVLITDGGPFGENKYFGRIDESGNFMKTGACNGEVSTLIKQFADNPADTAGKYGRLTGACCFCSRQLEDKRSTEVGYGPICADHYGLPWGN